MRLLRRDLVATGLVALAGILYLLWAVDWTIPGMSSTRATGIAVLALGFAASVSAVVPGFDRLIRGNQFYLAVTSLIGIAALMSGIVMLANASDAALSALMGTMGALWLVATIRHVVQGRVAASARGGEMATIERRPGYEGETRRVA